MRAVIKPLAVISLLFNATLLFSVTLNLDWAKTRAAGGQFLEFPVALRIIYLFMGIAMLYLISKLFNNSNLSAKQNKIVGYIFSASVLMQLISRSANERWNAIPAAIIAINFFVISKKSGD